MMLITLEQAKQHLLMDHDEDDQHILLLSEAASEAVINYLKDGAEAFLESDGAVPIDSNGDPMVPRVVQAATLIMMAEMYKNREGQPENMTPAQYGYLYLNNTVMSLLAQLRDPAVR